MRGSTRERAEADEIPGVKSRSGTMGDHMHKSARMALAEVYAGILSNLPRGKLMTLCQQGLGYAPPDAPLIFKGKRVPELTDEELVEALAHANSAMRCVGQGPTGEWHRTVGGQLMEAVIVEQRKRAMKAVLDQKRKQAAEAEVKAAEARKRASEDEELAKAICREAGHDPDALVTQYAPITGGSPLGVFTFVPQGPVDGVTPLWTHYLDVAKATRNVLADKVAKIRHEQQAQAEANRAYGETNARGEEKTFKHTMGKGLGEWVLESTPGRDGAFRDMWREANLADHYSKGYATGAHVKEGSGATCADGTTREKDHAAAQKALAEAQVEIGIVRGQNRTLWDAMLQVKNGADDRCNRMFGGMSWKEVWDICRKAQDMCRYLGRGDPKKKLDS